MCPKRQVHLDHRQDGGEDGPVPTGYVRTLRDVCRFGPVPPQLAGTRAASHVIGAQADLWTEVVEGRQRAGHRAFPRPAAFAGVVWPEPGARDRAEFERRMAGAHRVRPDVLGVACRPPSGPCPRQRRPGAPGRPAEGRPRGVNPARCSRSTPGRVKRGT